MRDTFGLFSPLCRRKPSQAEEVVQIVGISDQALSGERACLATMWPQGSCEHIAAALDLCTRGELNHALHAHLRALIPSVQLECGIVRVADEGLENGGTRLLADLPQCQWRSFEGPPFVSCGLLRHWMHQQRDALPAFSRVRHIAMHGMLFDRGEACFYVAFGSVQKRSPWQTFLLQLMTPHLLGALLIDVSAQARPSALLTGRETEVLHWICRGKSNKEIAAILHISVWTVKIHVGRVLSKLNASTRSHAVTKAHEAGLVDLGGASGFGDSLDTPPPKQQTTRSAKGLTVA